MTTPGIREMVLDEQLLDDLMSRAERKWGGSRGQCRWMTTPSETTSRAAAAGIRRPETEEAEEAVREAPEPGEQPPAAAVAEQPAAEQPRDERGHEPESRESGKAPEATPAKAPRPARARRAKKAETPRPARTRGTKKR
jgi:hypothetical protein